MFGNKLADEKRSTESFKRRHYNKIPEIEGFKKPMS